MAMLGTYCILRGASKAGDKILRILEAGKGAAE